MHFKSCVKYISCKHCAYDSRDISLTIPVIYPNAHHSIVITIIRRRQTLDMNCTGKHMSDANNLLQMYIHIHEQIHTYIYVHVYVCVYMYIAYELGL